MSLRLGTNVIAGSTIQVGQPYNVGQIIESIVPLTDAGLHLLDGALINGSGIYSDFVTYIAGLVSTYPDLFETEANWQTAVTTYGVCGKFVYDSVNNTVRLPKITGIIEGTTDLTALGDLVQAGLPNITGTFSATRAQGYDQATGAFSQDSTLITSGAGSGTYGRKFYFDASASNSIYGNSNTVQPQTIKVLYYIVIATSTKTSIQVDIDEVVTDLNGKTDVDLSNCTKPHIVETYVNGTSGYNLYSNGYCEQWGRVNAVYSGTSVGLLKQYANTDYNVIVTVATNAGTDQATVNPFGLISSTSAILVGSGYSAGHSCHWRTCGYIN